MIITGIMKYADNKLSIIADMLTIDMVFACSDKVVEIHVGESVHKKAPTKNFLGLYTAFLQAVRNAIKDKTGEDFDIEVIHENNLSLATQINKDKLHSLKNITKFDNITLSRLYTIASNHYIQTYNLTEAELSPTSESVAIEILFK